MGGYSYRAMAAIAAVMMVTIMTITPVAMARQRPVAQVNRFCKFARYKPLCNAMVKGARTHHEAVKNAAQSMVDIAAKEPKVLMPMVTAATKILGLRLGSQSSIISQCKEAIIDATDELRSLIRAIDQEDNESIDYVLRTGTITMRSCVNAFEEFGRVPAGVSKWNQDIENHKETALVIFKQKPIEALAIP